MTSGTGGGAPPTWPSPRPPKRSSGIANAARVVVAVVAIILVASFVRGLLDGSSGTSSATEASPTDPTAPYLNEDYTPPAVDDNPPAVPAPRDDAAVEELTQANPLYDQSVPTPTHCTLSSLDLARASAAAKQEHFNALMGCLMTVFIDPVEDAGFELPRPPVIVYSRPITTACGEFSDLNAAYCAGDQRIYYADDLLDAFPSSVADARYAGETILAHEFGHAVQARTAILVSEKYLELDARTEEEALSSSRRLEVQADCLAGQYVRSVALSQGLGDADLADLGTLMNAFGDDVSTGQEGFSAGHGLGATRQIWFARGLSSDAISVCNTFTASEDAVR